MTRRTRFVAIGVVVVVVVIVAGSTLRQGRGAKRVALQLSDTGSGCRPQQPAIIGNKWHGAVQWEITNTCGVAQYVKFYNYRPYLAGGGLGDPESGVIEPDPLLTGNPIAGDPNRPTTVTARIGKFILTGAGQLYKYDICIGTDQNNINICIDPDGDVWPVF